jgi:hypothetical protein
MELVGLAHGIVRSWFSGFLRDAQIWNRSRAGLEYGLYVTVPSWIASLLCLTSFLLGVGVLSRLQLPDSSSDWKTIWEVIHLPEKSSLSQGWPTISDARV